MRIARRRSASCRRQEHLDAIRDVEAGVLAGVLDPAHEVAGVALGLELGRDLRCRARPPCRCVRSAWPAPPSLGLRLSSNSSGASTCPATATAAVILERPVAGAHRGEHVLHRLAELGARASRRSGLRTKCAVRLEMVAELDGLDVDLALDQRAHTITADPGAALPARVTIASGRRVRSPCSSRSASAVEQTSRTRSMRRDELVDPTGRLSAAGQSSRCTLSVAGEAREHLLGDHRQQRRRHLAHGDEHACTACRRRPASRRASWLQNRSRERRMYQFVSASRYVTISWQAPAMS